MTTRGRLEGQITVPSGGWDISVTGSSSGTATVPAGAYYLTSAVASGDSLLDKLASVLSSTTGDTVTATISDGESGGTGKVTLASDGGTFAITWDDTDLRDLLGFTGDLSSSTSYTGSNHARMVWLPDQPKRSPYGDDDTGTDVSDARASENASTVKVVYGKRWREIQPGELTWRGISHARTRIAGESTTNESFERFWRDAILGEGPGGTPGGPIRVVWDADTAGTYATYMVVGDLLRSFRPEQMRANWTGRWNLDMGRLLEQ